MLLAGFERPTSGHIRLKGKPIETLPPHQRNMGVVFQSYSLFPHMTVAQNVAFPLSVRRKDGGRGSACARAGQGAAAGHGRAQAAAALGRPAAARGAGAGAGVRAAAGADGRAARALDKKLREEMQLEIRGLHRELGVTMVYVTHDQSEAMTLSDRVAVFNHGRIEQLDRAGCTSAGQPLRRRSSATTTG